MFLLRVPIALRHLPYGINWDTMAGNINEIQKILPLIRTPIQELLDAHDILSANASPGPAEDAAQQGILAEDVWHELSHALPFLQGVCCAVTNPSLQWLENRLVQRRPRNC